MDIWELTGNGVVAGWRDAGLSRVLERTEDLALVHIS